MLAEDGASQINGLISSKDSDGTGGSIQILGKDILLDNRCILDCSGQNGGGEIYIGGNFSLANPLLLRALSTTVASKAFIKNDAILRNNGGKTVVWSQEKTDFSGSISARGGRINGNGGLTGVCSEKDLQLTGNIDISANNGKKGLCITDFHVLVFNEPFLYLKMLV